MITLEVQSTAEAQLIDITERVQEAVSSFAAGSACIIFCPHTTGGLLLNEGTDPAVADDLLMYLREAIPADSPWTHAEGNSPAHIKSSLIGSSVTLLLEDGRLALGRWQRLFFCEFDGPRTRRVYVRGLA